MVGPNDPYLGAPQSRRDHRSGLGLVSPILRCGQASPLSLLAVVNGTYRPDHFVTTLSVGCQNGTPRDSRLWLQRQEVVDEECWPHHGLHDGQEHQPERP